MVIIGIILILANTPPVTFFFGEQYHYQNRDGSFEFIEQPGKGQSFETLKLRFESFLKHNPQNPHQELYRTFRLKPWKFWEWWRMIWSYDRYQLEYLPIDQTPKKNN